MASSSHQITHILFDLDGTLINSPQKLVGLLETMLSEKGVQITERIKDYVPNLVSLSKLNELIHEDTGLKMDDKEFVVDILRALPKTDLELMPGVEKLVTHLKKHGIPMAVASGSLKTYFDAVSPRFGTFFTDNFTHIVMAFDDPEIINKKPHPDVYFTAIKRFPTPPESMANVLVFEDSITGLKGTLESGAPVVLVGKLSEELKRDNAEVIAKANLVIESMVDFRPEVFGLPSF